MYAAGYQIESQANDAGFSTYSPVSIVVLVGSTNGTLEPTAIAHIALNIRGMKNVRSVTTSGDIAQLMNKDKTAALVMVQPKDDDRDTVVDEVNHMSAPVGTTVRVLGPTDPPSWREPASWAASGIGALLVFASGAMAFAGSRSITAATGTPIPGYPAPGTYPAIGQFPQPQAPLHSQPVFQSQPLPSTQQFQPQAYHSTPPTQLSAHDAPIDPTR
ncbi:hypothetical protein ACFXHA_35115 [Nocardia sp. NPDC059240]|uniref:hypothetical protein n=1 Tax=Nocardia sp. NPDC059240 TaxID=3346786 RepID=UPI003677765E